MHRLYCGAEVRPAVVCAADSIVDQAPKHMSVSLEMKGWVQDQSCICSFSFQMRSFEVR